MGNNTLRCTIRITIGLALVWSLMGCAGPLDGLYDESQTYYTAHNMWLLNFPAATYLYDDPGWIPAINYKQGDLLPAGTPIRSVQYISRANRTTTRSGLRLITNEDLKLQILLDRHQVKAGLTIEDLFLKTLTLEPLSEMTAACTQEEIDLIRSGVLDVGMSKPAVLLSWGYPPIHKTPTLEQQTWTYWTSRFNTVEISFDAEDRIIEIVQ